MRNNITGSEGSSVCFKTRQIRKKGSNSPQFAIKQKRAFVIKNNQKWCLNTVSYTHLIGASSARGGKAFICMSSTYKDKSGQLFSRVLPQFNGDIITSPRSQVYFLATEYGVINMEGRSTWELSLIHICSVWFLLQSRPYGSEFDAFFLSQLQEKPD